MRDRFGAKDERSWKLRFHTQTAGVSLTAQQPYNNVVRTALQALSAVLGGTNSLHTNSLDEALALPTAEAATLALRTQQIIAHESGVANVVDPLGGSYFVERLTRDLEGEALRTTSSTSTGWAGWSRPSSTGFPQQRDRRERLSLSAGGRAQGEDDRRRERLRRAGRAADADSLHRRRAGETPDRAPRAAAASRDGDAVQRALDACERGAAGDRNTDAPILDAVRAYATLGEMCDALREVWGEYERSRCLQSGCYQCSRGILGQRRGASDLTGSAA